MLFLSLLLLLLGWPIFGTLLLMMQVSWSKAQPQLELSLAQLSPSLLFEIFLARKIDRSCGNLDTGG